MEEKIANVYLPGQFVIFSGNIIIELQHNFPYFDIIPKEIIKKDQKNAEYFKLSSYEDDLLSKEFRKILFDWFDDQNIYCLDLVKYEKRKLNLCLKHLNISISNLNHFPKKYQKIKIIAKIENPQKFSKGLFHYRTSRKLNKNLSYYYF
jgi:hypothetical protein